jgi:hypothetical protein
MTVDVCVFSAGTTNAAGLDIFTDRLAGDRCFDFTNRMSDLGL